MEEMEKKLAELMADEAFAARLEQAETEEAVAAVFAEAGIEVDMDSLRKALAAQQANAELNAEELEEVAGGSVTGILVVGGKIIKYAFDQTPGANAYEKAAYIYRFWKGVFSKKK